MNKIIIWAGVIAAIGGGTYFLTQEPTPRSAVVTPAFSVLATEGEAVFQNTCAACHGADLTGGEQGPPLLHPFYKPDHHGDGAIVRAVQIGSRQHHWGFGNMPPQPHITDAEIVGLIAYIREMQQANGIN